MPERALACVVVLIICDTSIFKGMDGWAPVVAILVLEVIGLLVLVYRL